MATVNRLGAEPRGTRFAPPVDVFMGLVLDPVLGGLDDDEKASVFSRFTPKMTFLMPVIAVVTITAGVELAKAVGYWASGDRW